jgi:GR25 family glycosyltransferase involved in LPS biosynthesis
MFTILGKKLADIGFYINLDKSTDRKTNVENQIKKYEINGLERFSALTDEMIQYSCTKSHLSVLNKSLKEGYETVFIAEDDFQIYDECYYNVDDIKNINFEQVLNSVHEDLKNIEWDVVLLGCNPKSYIIKETDNLGVINKSTGAWAYLIKNTTFQFIIDNLNYKKDYLAIDDFLPKLNEKGFKVLTTIPMMIGHAVGFVSTLQPRGEVNYTNWINGNYNKFLYDNFKKKEINNLQNNLTIVINGHFCEDFIFYLKYLLHSLPDELKKCRFIVRYDRSLNNNKTLEIQRYFKDLQTNINAQISVGDGGLISSVNYSLKHIKTKYFLFLEHDWVFLKKDSIDFNKLIDVMNDYDFVNAVWFSKDDNRLRGFEIAIDSHGIETPFTKENRINELDLVTTVRWSNNPAVFRTEKYKEWYEKYIHNPYVGTQNQKSHNVEEPMIKIYRELISQNKFEDIKDDWGTYLYGNIGDGPYVGHTDASKRYQTTNKTMAEENGNEYIKNNPLK